MAATVRVRGEAVVPGEPDEVRVSLLITALEPTPEEAMSTVARRSDELEAVLGDLEVPRSGRSTTGVSVRERSTLRRLQHDLVAPLVMDEHGGGPVDAARPVDPPAVLARVRVEAGDKPAEQNLHEDQREHDQ